MHLHSCPHAEWERHVPPISRDRPSLETPSIRQGNPAAPPPQPGASSLASSSAGLKLWRLGQGRHPREHSHEGIGATPPKLKNHRLGSVQAGRGQLAPCSEPAPHPSTATWEASSGWPPSLDPILLIHWLCKEHCVPACPCVPNNVDPYGATGSPRMRSLELPWLIPGLTCLAPRARLSASWLMRPPPPVPRPSPQPGACGAPRREQ